MTVQHIEIVEVAPRDGLQSEPDRLPTAVKLELIRRVLASGIRRVEVASFVNPERVPQMADAEDVVAGLPRGAGARYIGLVLNERGFERALAAGVDDIGFVVVASDTFSRRNQGVGTDESIRVFGRIAAAARKEGLRSSVSIASAFGCPFEGEVPSERVLSIADALLEHTPDELSLADTVGVGVPRQVEELFTAIGRRAPDVSLRAHLHNTRNTGLANACAAVAAGVAAIDSSAGGIGGCPFAPAATGNIATEDLLYLLERSGIETGVSLPAAIETSEWLQKTLGRQLPAMLPKAGIFPKPQKSAA
jgi:hydroxymethylglutaryl-CoA lyase